MKPPRSVYNFFIDRLEVHINIIKYVTRLHSLKYSLFHIETVQNIQITNNIHRNIQYIHSDTLLFSNTNYNRLCVIIWGSSSTYIQ